MVLCLLTTKTMPGLPVTGCALVWLFKFLLQIFFVRRSPYFKKSVSNLRGFREPAISANRTETFREQFLTKESVERDGRHANSRPHSVDGGRHQAPSSIAWRFPLPRQAVYQLGGAVHGSPPFFRPPSRARRACLRSDRQNPNPSRFSLFHHVGSDSTARKGNHEIGAAFGQRARIAKRTDLAAKLSPFRVEHLGRNTPASRPFNGKRIDAVTAAGTRATRPASKRA